MRHITAKLDNNIVIGHESQASRVALVILAGKRAATLYGPHQADRIKEVVMQTHPQQLSQADLLRLRIRAIRATVVVAAAQDVLGLIEDGSLIPANVSVSDEAVRCIIALERAIADIGL